MENVKEKKEFYIAVSEYNRFHTPIYFSYIANKLGISRQALNQLTAYGTKKRFGEYKEKLEKILPKELFDNILFPENWRKAEIYKKINEKVYFDYTEKSRIDKVSWCLTKVMYDNVKRDKGFTPYMHDKVMRKVEEAEEWENKCACVKMTGSDLLLESGDETL